MPLLSLLICTLQCRKALLARLMERLHPQLNPAVQIAIDCDAGEVTIGEKRNRLLDRAAGDYIAFIDDDDLVAEDYVAQILSVLSPQSSALTPPDVVGFRSIRYIDGKLLGNCTYSITVKNNAEIEQPGDRYLFTRTPTHLCPIRREHVLATRFQPWCFGEDRDFAMRVLPRLKTEVFIDQDLYLYYLRTAGQREHEQVHPSRWHDDNARITPSYTLPASR